MRSLISDRLTRTFAMAKAATISLATAIATCSPSGLLSRSKCSMACAHFFSIASWRAIAAFAFSAIGSGVMSHFLLLSSERDGVVEVAAR